MSMLSNQQIAKTYFTKGSLWKHSTSSDEVKEVTYYIVLGGDDMYINTLVIRTKEDKITSVSNFAIRAGVFIEQLTYVGSDCSYLNKSKIDISFAHKWL